MMTVFFISLSLIKGAYQTGGVRYSFGITQDDINAYVKNAKSKENTEDYKKYASASDRLVSDVIDDVNISGYSHALRDNDIRHIFNSHGENTSEKYPVTETDIEMIPFILENYDKVYFRTSNKGKPSLLYVMAAGINNLYFVEQALENYNGEKLLVNKQMIKTGVDDIPSSYLSTITKKQSKTDFLADLNKARKEHARGVNQFYSINSIRDSTEKSNPSGENNSDAAYLSLAEKYRDGMASEEETEQLRQMVDEAAKN